ncbi:unnamed protein product [uncultured bacterium]|nr:unnamed protein product [uncultured bacterium]
MSDAVALPDTAPDPPRRRDPAATRWLWADRLARFRAADQSVAEFCAAEGVSVPAFYQWKRVLAAEAAGPADPPPLIPVRLAAAPAPIELVLPGGAVLRFAAGTDPAVIAAVGRQPGVAPC